jgi:predicted dinucleotide-binding enzyme
LGIDKSQRPSHDIAITHTDWLEANHKPKGTSTMKVAIIGAGNVGKALAASITRAGHDVTMSASTPESAREAAESVGASPADSNVAAVEGADVVILAVPYATVLASIADEIRGATAGRTIIDVTNPLRPDYSGLAVEGTSAAEQFQAELPDANLIKAFNTVFASNQASPTRDVDAFIAGDDGDAKRQVMELADSMGFAPVDTGALQTARYLEGMAFLNIGLNAANGWAWTSAWKLDR